MTSAYAVAGQMGVAASNYAVFVLLAWLLDPDTFVSFSTAVGLNMLSVAVAEGGVSYVAPRDLAMRQGSERGRLAAALLGLSTLLYTVSMIGGFMIWNAWADEPLELTWVAGYAVYVIPTLWIPPWITGWSLDIVGGATLLACRAAVVALIALFPQPSSFWLSGLGFLAFVFWLLHRLNRAQPVIGWPGMESVREAIRSVSAVFWARTASYGMYGLAPLMIGVGRGSAAASSYVTGERLKSLYTTLFQPIVHTAYLRQFQVASPDRRRTWLQFGVQAANILMCAVGLAATQMGFIAILGERFAEVEHLWVYLLAGGSSVASAGILYFKVFPAGAFQVFRRATFAQMTSFAAVFVAVFAVPALPVAWVLGVGEVVLLVSLVILVHAPHGAASSPDGARPAPPAAVDL